MADKNKTSSQRIAFTLPISCQICLGKVKEPVVCPNQHVFCKPCMDVWLEKNQQCPSCRVLINDNQPCKKVLGGLSHTSDDSEDTFSNKALRKSRTELLFREYEDEIDRLNNQSENLKQENQLLKDQMEYEREQRPANDKRDENYPSKATHDVDQLLVLSNKLQDLNKQYAVAKKQTKMLEKENDNLKEANVNMTRENNYLRMEMANRSPRRYGRFNVAALENKLESYEKEISQLKKALEKSDTFIEDLEKQLESYQTRLKIADKCSKCKSDLRSDTSPTGASKKASDRKLVGSPYKVNRVRLDPPSTGKQSESSKKPVATVNFYGKKPVGSSNPNEGSPKRPSRCNMSMSFELEAPSPVTPSSSFSRLTLDSSLGNDDQLNPGDSLVPTEVEHCRKKLKFDSNITSNCNGTSPSTSRECLVGNKKQVTFCEKTAKEARNDPCTSDLSTTRSDYSELESPENPRYESFDLSLPDHTADSTLILSDTSADLDLNASSMTDISECLRLLDAAEKKVESRRLNTCDPTDVGSQYRSSNFQGSFPDQSAAKHSTVLKPNVPKTNYSQDYNVNRGYESNKINRATNSYASTPNIGSISYPTFQSYPKVATSLDSCCSAFDPLSKSTSTLERMLNTFHSLESDAKLVPSSSRTPGVFLNDPPTFSGHASSEKVANNPSSDWRFSQSLPCSTAADPKDLAEKFLYRKSLFDGLSNGPQSQ